jgi:hypothetical protein
LVRKAALAAFSVIVALAGLRCAAPPIEIVHENLKGTHYLRHNLKYIQSGSRQLTYRTNWLDYPNVIAYGAEVQIPFYSTQYVDLRVNNIPCRMLSHDGPFPQDSGGIAAFMEKHFSNEPVSPDINPLVANGLQAGRIAQGMSKEEVILSVGYPAYIDDHQPAVQLDHDAILASDQWIYHSNQIMWMWTADWIVQFGDGKVINVVN